MRNCDGICHPSAKSTGRLKLGFFQPECSEVLRCLVVLSFKEKYFTNEGLYIPYTYSPFKNNVVKLKHGRWI